MKRIILIRHARAEDQNPDLPDLYRSLTFRGKEVCEKMAILLKSKIPNPGVMVTSHAFRAYETALIFSGVFGINPESLVLRSSIYGDFNEKALLEVISAVKEEEETITLFGHNPAFTDLAIFLGKEIDDVIPKCGIVSITFDIKTWSDIKAGSGRTELFLKPKKVL